MPWKRERFKGNKVYIRTDCSGIPLEEKGRVELRYKLDDPRTYRVAANHVEPLAPEDGGDRIWPDEEAVEGKAPELVNSNSEPPATDFRGSLVGAGQKRQGKEGRRSSSGGPYFGDKPPIVIYTDGACSGNPGPAGIGIVMLCGDRRKEWSEFLGNATNNIAELTAVQRALELVKDRQRTVMVFVDSAYSIGVLSGWLARSNLELIGRIKTLMDEFPDLRLVKVAGHKGILENERCDRLARDALSNASVTVQEPAITLSHKS